MKLFRKILYVVFAASLSGILVIALLIFFFVQSTLRKSIGDSQLSTANEIVSVIDRYLYERYNNIQSIAGDGEVIDILLDEKGVPNIQNTLDTLSSLTGPWELISIVNTDGVVVAQNDSVLQNTILETADDVAFHEALRDRVYYSDLLFLENGTPTLIFSSPVKDLTKPDRPIVGVVIAHFAWPAIFEMLDRQGIQVELFNSSGFEIAGNLPEDVDEILKLDASNSLPIKRALDGEEGSVLDISEEGGVEQLTSYTIEKGFLDYKGNDWIITVSSPTSVILAATVSDSLKVIATSIPLIFGLSTIVLIIFKKLLKPIQSLTSATQEVASGRFGRLMETQSDDELGDLSRSFNMMNKKLGDLYINLESKVKEKTKELSGRVSELEDSKKAMLNLLDDEKTLEDELRREKASVEQKVILRTKELKESQQRELNKANELLKLKDEFVFIASHDLKTPVTAIEGYLSFIEDEKTQLPRNIEMSIKAVGEASERLKQLVNDLLEVARGESGTIKVKVSQVNINELIARVAREVTPVAERKKVVIGTLLDEKSKLVLADEEKLFEVLENLISNAIKFNREQGHIDIKSRTQNGFLVVDIADTGHGIPVSEQKNVFQKFFKYRADSTMGIPGTGLGLFVVRMLIEKMGGKIGFFSEEEKGTTFTFTLPLVKAR